MLKQTKNCISFTILITAFVTLVGCHNTDQTEKNYKEQVDQYENAHAQAEINKILKDLKN